MSGVLWGGGAVEDLAESEAGNAIVEGHLQITALFLVLGISVINGAGGGDHADHGARVVEERTRSEEHTSELQSRT